MISHQILKYVLESNIQPEQFSIYTSYEDRWLYIHSRISRPLSGNSWRPFCKLISNFIRYFPKIPSFSVQIHSGYLWCLYAGIYENLMRGTDPSQAQLNAIISMNFFHQLFISDKRLCQQFRNIINLYQVSSFEFERIFVSKYITIRSFAMKLVSLERKKKRQKSRNVKSWHKLDSVQLIVSWLISDKKQLFADKSETIFRENSAIFWPVVKFPIYWILLNSTQTTLLVDLRGILLKNFFLRISRKLVLESSSELRGLYFSRYS